MITKKRFLPRKALMIFLNLVLCALCIGSSIAFALHDASDGVGAAERPLYYVSGAGSAEYGTAKAYNEYLSDIKNGLVKDGEKQITLDDYEVDFNYSAEEDGVYEDVTGLLVSLKPNDSLIFNKVVNLAKLTKNNPLITMSCLPTTVGQLDMKRINVKLTDVYDKDKYLILKLKNHEIGDGNYISYTMVSVCSETNECLYSQKYASLTYGKDSHFSFWGRPGLSAKGKVVYKNELSRAKEAFSFYYDNDYGVVYQSDAYQEYTLTCDTKAAAQFEGFTTGEVIVEVYADRYVGSSANFIIKGFAGTDLSKNVTDDIGALIAVDYDENDVPVGKVGYKYPLFDAKAYDKANGEVSVNAIVYKNYYSDNRSVVEVKDNAFVPKTEGTYTICYFATDSYGDVSEKPVDVTVIKEGRNLELGLEDKTENAVQGEKVTLAKAIPSGGTGKISVTASVTYNNGEKCEVKDNAFTPLKTGTYVVEITAEDFIGQKATQKYNVTVTENGNPVVTEDLDKIVHKNFILSDGSKKYSYRLTSVGAYSFGNGGYKIVDTQVSADNGTITNGVYTPEKEGEVTFSYKHDGKLAGSITRKVYKITRTVGTEEVIDINKLFIPTGDVVVGYSENSGSRYLIDNDESYIEFINSLVAEDLSFDFLTEKGFNAIGKVNFYLTDTENDKETVKLSFIKNANKAYFAVNDGSMNELVAAFSGNSNDVFKFSLRPSTQVITVDGKQFGIANYLSGGAFKGFSSGKVGVKITFESVGASGFAFVVKNVCAQSFAESVTKDTTKPIIKCLGENGGLKNKGEKFTLPETIAFDVISPELKNFTVTVTNAGNTVKDTSGKEIYNAEVAPYEISLDNYGEYMIAYTATDYSGRSQTLVCVVYVYDLEAPSVTIKENTKKTSGKVGEKITVAEIDYSDNTCSKEEITVCVFVKGPNFAAKKITDGTFTPETAGTYTIYYYVADAVDNEVKYSQGSVTVVSYTVEIK